MGIPSFTVLDLAPREMVLNLDEYKELMHGYTASVCSVMVIFYVEPLFIFTMSLPK